MYTVSKGPSKIVAKTRRGISQNLDRLDTLRDLTRKSDPSEKECDDEIDRHAPKPVFNVNGKSKISSQRHRMQEVITPQHEELIKFVYESWSQVGSCTGNGVSEDSHDSERGDLITSLYYNDGEPNDVLQDFKPFDLESWWGKRLFNNITKSL
ncbi:MAPK regulated corepressor interacting protein 2 [Microplitis demolitor]|uniref:MAPK regulated corepressor interacting protein 2 n=1 Tax=Microplitis demolitor TaxID=69319 RepID=UPI0004CCD0EB|nr:MAPK regulated corepressor interacting protein 2 [Microplitis demolitor]